LEDKRPLSFYQAKKMDATRIVGREFDINIERKETDGTTQNMMAQPGNKDMKIGMRLQEMIKEEHCMRTRETGDFSSTYLFKMEAMLESDGAASTWKTIVSKRFCHFS
jgi:hypothetical protein